MTTLMILMPTGGQIDTPAVHSLLGLSQALPKHRIPFALKTYEWSDLVISRNYLMSCFLADKKFTHALLLDSDMSYQPQVFFDLLNFDADFTVAPYPQRQMRWQTFRAAIEREAEKPPEDRAPTDKLLAESLRYNVSDVFDAGQPWPHEARDGFRKVPGAGTGFMLIRREVPERMVRMGVAAPRSGLQRTGLSGRRFPRFLQPPARPWRRGDAWRGYLVLPPLDRRLQRRDLVSRDGPRDPPRRHGLSRGLRSGEEANRLMGVVRDGLQSAAADQPLPGTQTQLSPVPVKRNCPVALTEASIASQVVRGPSGVGTSPSVTTQ